jgi:putative hydrolase of the HAD superfamily
MLDAHDTSPGAAAAAGPAPAATPAMAGAFAHVSTWVFDLDNTLYPPESMIWPRIDDRITAYLGEMFGIDGLSARALQKYYYTRYGTTLKGLMLEHDHDPHAFLDFVHEIDHSAIAPNPALGAAIERLPGRKLILTNGSRRHAENVARRLGILDHFEDVFDIVAADFTPKPERVTYETFLERHGVDPAVSAMFEDLARNLKVPHDLGMRTVLVVPRNGDPFREAWETIAVAEPFIQHVTDDLVNFLDGLAR